MLATMDIARLVLDYLKVLVWPGVVIAALIVFRGQVRDIASRVTRLSILGNEIEAAAASAREAVEDAVEVAPELPAPDDEATAEWLLPPATPRVADPDTRRAYEAIDLVETALRRLAYEVAPALVGETTLAAAWELARQDVIQPSMANTVADLLRVRARLANTLAREDATSIHQSAQTLFVVLQLIRGQRSETSRQASTQSST